MLKAGLKESWSCVQYNFWTQATSQKHISWRILPPKSREHSRAITFPQKLFKVFTAIAHVCMYSKLPKQTVLSFCSTVCTQMTLYLENLRENETQEREIWNVAHCHETLSKRQTELCVHTVRCLREAVFKATEQSERISLVSKTICRFHKVEPGRALRKCFRESCAKNTSFCTTIEAMDMKSRAAQHLSEQSCCDVIKCLPG